MTSGSSAPGSDRTRRGPGRPPKPPDDAPSALSQLGGLIRRWRTDRKLTLADLGVLTGYSWQHLSAVERGQVVPSEAVVVACERALAAGGQISTAFPAVVREQAWQRHHREAARRTAGARDHAVSDAALLPTAVTRPSALTADAMLALEQMTDRHRLLYHELSSAEMLIPVEAHLSLLTSLMRGAQPEPLRHRVASAAAEAAGLAAWLWHDLGDQFKTGIFYRMAESLLTQAENPALAGYITGFRALAADTAGSRAEAVSHAEVARIQTPVTASKLVKSWLAAVSANAVALTGDHREALRLLDQARDLFESAQDREAWMYDFDHSALAAFQGQCLLRLGRPGEAIAAFEAGLAELSHDCERRRAGLMIDLAEACVPARDADASAHFARQALLTFASRGSVEGMARVQRLSAMLESAGYGGQASDLHLLIRGCLPDET
jgi:transcriptional regulator with XRE-family HTH domain